MFELCKLLPLLVYGQIYLSVTISDVYHCYTPKNRHFNALNVGLIYILNNYVSFYPI